MLFSTLPSENKLGNLINYDCFNFIILQFRILKNKSERPVMDFVTSHSNGGQSAHFEFGVEG